MKLIDLHKKWCGRMGLVNGGLCASIPKEYKNQFSLIRPTHKEKHQSLIEDGHGIIFWGKKIDQGVRAYTPLRQTIVLLICAMNNEL